MSKDAIFRLHTPTGAQNILVADRDTHSRQRRLLSHAFSEAALREQEPILQFYARKLLDQLSRRCSGGSEGIEKQQAQNMVAWLTFASFDLIGHMSFGENFGCLDNTTYAPFVQAITAMASELTIDQMCRYWGVLGLRKLFVPKAALGQRQKNIRTAMQTVARRIANGSEHRDFLHYVLEANDEKKGMSPAEIHVNAFSLSIAGSESTATALSGALYLLLTHDVVYERLVAEIHAAHESEEDITLASTQRLTYLDAVITETLRIYPPVAISMPRCVPGAKGDGEVIAGAFVPAGTTVGVHYYAAFHSPANFARAEEFLPERWLADDAHTTSSNNAFASDCKGVMQPFSFGPRNCLGKNIARAEMRLLLAKLLWRFEWRLEHREEQGEWMRQSVRGFWQKKELWCVLALVER